MSSLLYATPPAPVEVGRRPLGGGWGGLAAEEGFSRGLASRCELLRGGGARGEGLAEV